MDDPGSSPLLTDLYQLNMIQAYLDHGVTGTAVFEFFVRKLPPCRGFFLAAGLEQALDFLEGLKFTPSQIDWLKTTGRFSSTLIEYLEGVGFTGDVYAMPEGTVFFENEPIFRVVAPLPVAQLVETRLINILHFETLIATKAARSVIQAPGKQLVDFGLRRSHGAEAGLLAARASYVAGFAGTATVLAAERFGIPLYGTMAHSFVQAFESETAAFEAFAESCPRDVILLVDTYNTEAAARKVVELAPRLKARGITVRGVRLDSGDLLALSRSVRQILDQGGLADVVILASGGLDEVKLSELAAAGAPIDGYGIGTSLTTSSDVPALDCAYKLEEYNGLARRKRSTGKATWPGRKQVWRRYGAGRKMCGDTLSVENDEPNGEPLLKLVMKKGRILKRPMLAAIRETAAQNLAALPGSLRGLSPAGSYPVVIGEALQRLTEEVDTWVLEHGG